jgi:hypothetical protein
MVASANRPRVLGHDTYFVVIEDCALFGLEIVHVGGEREWLS